MPIWHAESDPYELDESNGSQAARANLVFTRRESER